MMIEVNRGSGSEKTSYAWCIVRRSWLDDDKPLIFRRYVSPLVGTVYLPLIFFIINFMILYLGIGELLFPSLSLNSKLEIIRKNQDDSQSRLANLNCKRKCYSVYDMEKFVSCKNACIFEVHARLTKRNVESLVLTTNKDTSILILVSGSVKDLDMLCSLSEFAVFCIQVIGLFLSNILIFHGWSWFWKVERSRTLWNALLGLNFITSRLGYFLWQMNSLDLSLIRFWFYVDIFRFIFLINKTGEYSPLSASLTGHVLILFRHQIDNISPISLYGVCFCSLILTLASISTVRLYSVQHYAVFITQDWKSFWKMHFGYDGDELTCLESTVMPVQGYDIMWENPCEVGSAFKEGHEILRYKFLCPNFESMKEESVRYMKSNRSFSCYTLLSSNCIFFAQTLFEHLTHENGSLFFRKKENWETYHMLADLGTMASATVSVPSTSLTLYDRMTRAILGVSLCLHFTHILGAVLYIICVIFCAKYVFLSLYSAFSLPLKTTNFVFRKLFCDRNDCWSCRGDWHNSLMTELKHRIPLALMTLVFLVIISADNFFTIILLLSHAVYHSLNARLPDEIDSWKDLLKPFVIAFGIRLVFVEPR